MNRSTGSSAFRRWPTVLALLVTNAVLGAGAVAPAVEKSSRPAVASKEQLPDEELDEVLVEGRKVTRDPQKVIDWLARLVGQFTYEGYVDLQGKGRPEDQRKVQGGSNCVGFGPAPAVTCEIKVSWPEARGANGEEMLGGASNLDPAMMMFGFEPDRIGIRYMLVDSKGIAEGALGLVLGDTLVSSAPCMNIPGDCQRVVRITAAPDRKVIETQIELEVDSQRVLSFVLVQNRVPGSAAVVMP